MVILMARQKLSKASIIKRHIKTGTYTRLEIKNKLEELYERYGINENAKATDLSEVYHIRPTTLRYYRRNSETNQTRVVSAIVVEPDYFKYL